MGGKSAAKASEKEAKQARADEQARQMRIRQGTSRVNSIFDGTFTPGGQQISLADAMAGKTYYDASGRQIAVKDGEDPMDVWARKALTEFGGDPTNAMQLATTKNNLAGQKLFTEGTRSGGFDDNFFANQRQRYIDYATPQLDEQYGKANKELTFALSRSGLLDSSVRGEKASDLQKLYDTNKQQVADDALTYETKARTAVEDARSNLIATLNATGDAEGAANSALARSTALSQPASYSPLANMFSDFTGALGAQAAAERSFAAGGPKPAVVTGLFAPRNAVQVK